MLGYTARRNFTPILKGKSQGYFWYSVAHAAGRWRRIESANPGSSWSHTMACYEVVKYNRYMQCSQINVIKPLIRIENVKLKPESKVKSRICL